MSTPVIEVRTDWAYDTWLKDLSPPQVLAWFQLNVCVAVYGRHNRVAPIDLDFLADFSRVSMDDIEEMLQAARAAGELLTEHGVWHAPNCIARRPI
jgi:hypothetical protein